MSLATRSLERSSPLAVPAVMAIALNTFREAIRDRVLYLIVFFALALIGASRFLALLTVGSQGKIIKDLGLSSIEIFGVLTSVFVGVSLVYKEIEKRTLYVLLASPIRRWHFIVGKYGGLMAVLGMNTAVMTAVLGGVLALRGESVLPLLPAVGLVYVQLAVVTAFAVLFSSFTKPILSAVATLAVYVAGQLSWSFDILAARLPSGPGRWICVGLERLVPNLHRLDLKAEAVHAVALPEGYVALAALHGGLYCVAVLLLACVVFERRDFV
jgi:hypothetical protein